LSLIGQTIHGNILIQSLIGEGAMGAVYLAENVELPDRQYAVKVLLNPITNAPMFQERFNEEARNQSILDHPNIVHVHDFFKEAGRYYLLMDYVDGEPLSKVIERGKLDEKRATEIMDGVLRGLNCAHEHGIVHRDVKPSNILIDKSGRARLTDFGIAIRAGEMRLTSTGISAVGTAAYMSPEQIRTPGKIDHLADVYSAGIVLFEMLTGDVPFHGETDFAVHQQQVKARPPNPRIINSTISARVTRIIALALAKNPRDRIQGCEQFRRMLAGEVDPPFPWKRVMLSAAGVVLCAAVVLAAVRWREWFPPPPPPPVAATSVNAEQIGDTATLALQSIESLCREFAAKTQKEKGKRLAEAIPDSARAAMFEQQIHDSQANIADFAKQYNHGLTRLAAFGEPAIAAAFQGTGSEAGRAAYVPIVERDAKRMRTAPADIDPTSLMQSCPSVTASP
jgi:tRNA A-37 threonylcarbamoyl transferase component Bud32